jgi:hypothetical protein
MADRLVIASTVSGGGSSGLLGLIGGSAQEPARRRGRTIRRPGSVMSGSCLQVCDGCSRPRSGLRPGSLLPHAPARPGGGRLAGAGPPPWSRLSGMAIALHAREGPTPYLVRDRSYFLPAAREITPCRPVLSQRDTEPGIAEILAKDVPGRTGHGHLMAGRHIAAGLPTASSWLTGGLPAGRPGGMDPLGRLRAVSALFAGTWSAPSVDARRGRLAGGAAGLASALRIRCGI